mmetsp:Transcript_11856/g.27348  ORF Transcript_11856/g.27348 Transcript_11856/m.27348 type:complete len:157 (-) Transcript_11856:135-605(-)
MSLSCPAEISYGEVMPGLRGFNSMLTGSRWLNKFVSLSGCRGHGCGAIIVEYSVNAQVVCLQLEQRFFFFRASSFDALSCCVDVGSVSWSPPLVFSRCLRPCCCLLSSSPPRPFALLRSSHHPPSNWSRHESAKASPPQIFASLSPTQSRMSHVSP